MSENRTYYEEAIRYISNAKAALAKAGKDGDYYKDLKYVKSAAGIAYAGVEQAAKWLLKLNGYKSQNYKSYSGIVQNMEKYDQTAANELKTCNAILHKEIYYRNEANINIFESAMKAAIKFIEYLKPYKEEYFYKKGGKVKK